MSDVGAERDETGTMVFIMHFVEGFPVGVLCFGAGLCLWCSSDDS